MIKIIFFFINSSEINEQDEGLTIELWSRGKHWDNLLGVCWLPLLEINQSNCSNDKSNDLKISLDSELCEQDGKIVGTQMSTGHVLFLNIRIELSNVESNEIESLELQESLDILDHAFKKVLFATFFFQFRKISNKIL